MFSSCSPSSALVAGVKIGSGSRSDSRRPVGSSIPQTAPVWRYSRHPEPERYPRATHSTGYMSRRLTRSARPSASAGTSSERKWLGTMSRVVSNQKTDIWVSTLPLSGIGVGRTTS